MGNGVGAGLFSGNTGEGTDGVRRVKQSPLGDLPGELRVGLAAVFLMRVGGDGDHALLNRVGAFHENQLIIVQDIAFAAHDGQRALLDGIGANSLSGNAFHVTVEAVATGEGTEGDGEREADIRVAVGFVMVAGDHADGAAHDGDLRGALHTAIGVQVLRHESPRADPQSGVKHQIGFRPDKLAVHKLVRVWVGAVCHQPDQFQRFAIGHHGRGDLVDIGLLPSDI